MESNSEIEKNQTQEIDDNDIKVNINYCNKKWKVIRL